MSLLGARFASRALLASSKTPTIALVGKVVRQVHSATTIPKSANEGYRYAPRNASNGGHDQVWSTGRVFLVVAASSALAYGLAKVTTGARSREYSDLSKFGQPKYASVKEMEFVSSSIKFKLFP